MTREPAGRWFRVSSGGQDEANQIPDIDKWCADHDYRVRKTYQLHGKSASKGKQDKMLNQVEADMNAGIIKVLVVWQSSRIERRGAYNVFDLFNRVQKAGGRIEFVQDSHLNVVGEMSDVNLAIAATVDRQKSRNIAVTTTAGLNRIKANGGVTGRPPYGYVTVGERYNRRLIQQESEAGVLREARDRYLGRGRDAESLDDICADLNARGVASPTWKGQPGKKWYAKTLGNLLRSESTAGRRRQGHMTHRFDGIFTWQEHLDLCARLDSRAHRKGITPGNTALLTSLLKCGTCGGPMNSILIGSQNYRRRAYYCRSKSVCKMAPDMADADEQAITQFLDAMGHGRYRKWEAQHAPNHQDEIDQLRQDRNGLDDMAADYEERHAELTAKIRSLAKLDEDNPPLVMVPVDQGCTIAQRFMRLGTVERRQDMLDAGVSFICVKDGRGAYTITIDVSSERTKAYNSALRLKG